MKGGFAIVSGSKIHYATAGSGPKMLLLLHGFPEFWYSWRHQIEALSDKFKVVAPDLRGYNLSDKPPGKRAYEMDGLIEEIAGLIRHFGEEKIFLAGHDWGALLAWGLAEKHPGLIEKLACLQVPPIAVWKKNISIRQLFASWYMFFFQVPLAPELLLSFADYFLLAGSLKFSCAKPGVFSDKSLKSFRKAWSQPNALPSMLNYYRANLWKLLLGKTSKDFKINVPTLFIYGEQDIAILPKTTKGIKNFINAEFKELAVPNAGHWIQQEEPQIISNALRQFFSET